MYRRGHREKMKILMLCSCSPDFENRWKRCLESQQKYCQKYGYTYKLENSPLLDGQTRKEWTWKKHYSFEKYRKEYDIFISIDADCEILNHTPSIETVVDETHSIYFVNGISNRPNAGFLIVKNDKIGNYFHSELIKRRDLKTPDGCKVKPDGDNGHVIWILSELKKHSKELSLQWNCSQPEYADTAYIIHYTNKMRYEYKQ